MKYFFDTEFIDDGRTIDLLSIGMVCEDGREFYQCNRDAKLNLASEWVIWNVYPFLNLSCNGGLSGWYWKERDTYNPERGHDLKAIVVHKSEIRDRLIKFIGDDDKPEFWAYFADYDWVVFCQLFGRMIDLPRKWPQYCNDLKQLCKSKGNPKLSKQENEHHALNDAKWVKEMHNLLTGE